MKNLERRKSDWPQLTCDLCGLTEGEPESERFMVWRSTGGWSWGFRNVVTPPGWDMSDPDAGWKEIHPGYEHALKAVKNGVHKRRPSSDAVHVTCDTCTAQYQEVAKLLGVGTDDFPWKKNK